MKKTKLEHALALFKAGISTVPWIGGAIASLIADYIPSSTQRSIETAIELLKHKLEQREDRIDLNDINKDEFAELFKSCYLTIVRTHQRSKLNAATSLISNILLKKGDPEKLSYTEIDHFVRCLDSLSIGAIQVLGHAVEIARQAAGENIESQSIRMDFGQLQSKMPDTEPSLLMGLIRELDSMNLLHFPGPPAIRTRDYSNYSFELTPIGARFVLRLLKDR